MIELQSLAWLLNISKTQDSPQFVENQHTWSTIEEQDNFIISPENTLLNWFSSMN